MDNQNQSPAVGPESEKTVFSLIQPTGIPTLGNYLGALKNWNKMSKDYN